MAILKLSFPDSPQFLFPQRQETYNQKEQKPSIHLRTSALTSFHGLPLLNQWFLTGVIQLINVHVTMSRDISGCHIGGGYHTAIGT